MGNQRSESVPATQCALGRYLSHCLFLHNLVLQDRFIQILHFTDLNYEPCTTPGESSVLAPGQAFGCGLTGPSPAQGAFRKVPQRPGSLALFGDKETEGDKGRASSTLGLGIWRETVSLSHGAGTRETSGNKGFFLCRRLLSVFPSPVTSATSSTFSVLL